MPLIRNGVQFSDALLEAASISPSGRAMLDALELYHPLVGRFWFVNNNESFFANLEPDAPDGDVLVEFLACPCRIKPPEESDAAATPETLIQVDNLSGLISNALKITRGSHDPWVLTNRKYASDDPSIPAQLPPTQVELRSVSIDGPTASLSCNFGDPGNVGIPALTFNRVEYPGLVR